MIREGAPIILHFFAPNSCIQPEKPKSAAIPTPQCLKRIDRAEPPSPRPKAQGLKPEA